MDKDLVQHGALESLSPRWRLIGNGRRSKNEFAQ